MVSQSLNKKVVSFFTQLFEQFIAEGSRINEEMNLATTLIDIFESVVKKYHEILVSWFEQFVTFIQN